MTFSFPTPRPLTTYTPVSARATKAWAKVNCSTKAWPKGWGLVVYQEVTATRQAEEGELRQTNTAGVDIWWAAALEDDTVGEGRKTVATVAVTMAAADLAVAETVVAGSAVR